VRGRPTDDAVIFCGSGATGAINKLIDILQPALPAELDARYGSRARSPKRERPVVFIGPFEHHSNELPWRSAWPTWSSSTTTRTARGSCTAGG
jgi:selenocysteine lyase/cysteine desulfurase